jgi:hypothetical protein
MRETFFEYVRIVALLGGALALVHFGGGFHGRAAFFLGGTFAIITVWLYLLRQVADFKPYRLTIGINYDALREDLRLEPAADPGFENFIFTAISPAVFARSDESGYSQLLILYKEIPCGADTWTAGPGGFRNRPSFFFRPSRDGYQFGVHVQAEWWEHNREQLAPNLRQLLPNRASEIVLGVLPYGYMPDHARRWNQPISFWYGFDRKQRRWKRILQQHGWSFLDDYPTRINHRYAGIGYSDI